MGNGARVGRGKAIESGSRRRLQRLRLRRAWGAGTKPSEEVLGGSSGPAEAAGQGAGAEVGVWCRGPGGCGEDLERLAGVRTLLWVTRVSTEGLWAEMPCGLSPLLCRPAAGRGRWGRGGGGVNTGQPGQE